MNQAVTLDAEKLRPYLLRWFAEESGRAADALGWTHNTEQAREHHMRAVLIAALLDQLGWLANGGSVTIDALEHGWAAAGALRAIIATEEQRIAGEVSLGEEEAAGAAMGRRTDAKRTLVEIEEAAERVGVSIQAPC